ncbi:unnamed protein product [Chrysoparadoxa australica]
MRLSLPLLSAVLVCDAFLAPSPHVRSTSLTTLLQALKGGTAEGSVPKMPWEAFYDKMAATYDEVIFGPVIEDQHFAEGVKLFLKRISETQGSILDVGCGTGLLKERLPRDFEFTGVDVSSEMLKRAAQRGYKVIHKPAEDALEEMADNSFDYVVALCSLSFVEDFPRVLANMQRVARKGIVLSIDRVEEGYRSQFAAKLYDHSDFEFQGAQDDYFIKGWTSSSTGIAIQTRMIYIPLSN